MTAAGLRPCPEPGCPTLIRGKQRACAEHMRAREARKPERIRGRRRQDRNARLFRDKPLCVECAKLGLVRAVDVWDHVVPLEHGGADDESNLQGLCNEHHVEKTSEERRQRVGGG